MLIDRINEDLKMAMKNKDAVALRGIRAIKAALLLLKTDASVTEITEEDEIKLLQKLAKQRRESIDVFTKQNRLELANTEEEELKIIETYLPAQLEKEEIENIVRTLISENGANSMSDIGKIMPLALKALSGKADGKTISEIVKKLLS
jgi:uncharacterized protein YqeY